MGKKKRPLLRRKHHREASLKKSPVSPMASQGERPLLPTSSHEVLPQEPPIALQLALQPLRKRYVSLSLALSVLLWGGLLLPMSQGVWSAYLDTQSSLQFVNAVTRALGVLLGTTITLCAIAIPLTANNYTPKLISLFLKNRVNQAMFAYMIFANIATYFLMTWTGGDALRVRPVFFAGFLLTSCFLLIIPFAYYVFRNLQPEQIISNIVREILDTIDEAVRLKHPEDIEEARRRVIQDIKYLSNIALRSIERHDRDTASFSMDALRWILEHYFTKRREMPPSWFVVEREDFRAHSGDMRQHFREGQSFLEGEVMEEFSLILAVSYNRLPDMIRMLGEIMMSIGIRAQAHQHLSVVELVSLYFNTYLRSAISQRQPRAIYILAYHYGKFAEALMFINPERTRKIAFYMDYYGHQAVRSGMVFVANLISYDLSALTRLAYARNAPCKKELLTQFLSFDDEAQMRQLPGVIKSQIKLATFMRAVQSEAEVDMLCESLKLFPAALVEAAFSEMRCVQQKHYWEVTDRREHNDFVEPHLRSHFEEIAARVCGC